MQKLRLDELKVESFATTGSGTSARGTVEGHQEHTWKYTCSCDRRCYLPGETGETACLVGCDTMFVTCGSTCDCPSGQDTCGCPTWDARSCAPDTVCVG